MFLFNLFEVLTSILQVGAVNLLRTQFCAASARQVLGVGEI
jgi:hypothetical protein